MNIPFLSFEETNRQIKSEMMQAIEKCVDSKWYVLGNEVKQFEEAYAKYSTTQFAVGVANGLDALHLSLLALGIKRGDEVIVPSNTYIATVLAISYTGARPVFVEPDLRTYNIDPDKIEEKITPKTKAIMPVHLYGQACEMDKIMAIASQHGLYIVEDNAQAHGASFKDRLTGSFGDINATSFYPGKNLGALGDAGGITTNSEVLYMKCLSLRNYGSNKKYYNEVIGFNSRLDEVQAAILSVKLNYINSWTTQRIQLSNWYIDRLSACSDLILPATASGATHVYHLFTVRTDKRDTLQQALHKSGIGTLIHYPVPPHLQEAYRHLQYKKGDFPIAEEISNTTLSLPLFIGMTENQVNEVCDVITSFYR
ncbi:MAG: DegT/DnrJ/EryC1/StrS family aminotransferase [Cytophagaceae bacterium]|jgi:dTDP-4-amino-4,6-dideoxygalactose transaminase|nr:DegT/DnrJ/EryC1/StrS family aminotransferase [Cytophagaceae bacterium]